MCDRNCSEYDNAECPGTPGPCPMDVAKELDIDIKPGPKLDRAMAEAIGWRHVDDEQHERILPVGDYEYELIPLYSTDLNAAFAAADETRLWAEYGYCQAAGQCVISKTVPVASWGDTIAHAATPALAICAAILKLKEAKSHATPETLP